MYTNDLEQLLKDSLDKMIKIKECLLKISREGKQNTDTMMMNIVELRKLKDEFVSGVSTLKERTLQQRLVLDLISCLLSVVLIKIKGVCC